ncbi:ABC transporter permease [Eubacterium oxidoreducens]|uniref:Putative ABC transport system permease protein n=1 Tax=Eubacterium oxidoreducens TaxID=1732 RepID=A0A1G6BKI4_EUBOX|nr:ABC transporter permease [Eubacterium oxidoreducens]SDB21152.1 putative ABC transport system permease protein [Eubacterium oxidoreducens]
MIIQSFKMALKAVLSNKMRSFLTMLGIIIGVMSLVVLVSMASGTTDSVSNQISSMGTDMLSVSISDDDGNPLKLADLEEIEANENISGIAAVTQTSLTAENDSTSETVNVYGTTADYDDIMDVTLSTGRFIKTVDVENHSNIIIISQDVATDIIGYANCLGETISLNGYTYTIVGILEEDDSSSSSSSTYEAYIPYTTLIRTSDSVSTDISSFVVSAADEDSMDAAEAYLDSYLLERFGDSDYYSVTSSTEIAETMESVTGMLTLLLGGIAGISLLVGGIGIMNIMLVSVTERTREIGIRKAIGACKGVIMLQFLIESLVVSLVGCAIGIGLSWITLKIAAIFASDYDLNFTLSMGVVWIAILFSLAIGIIFGLYPAHKASKKNPIEALRYIG